MNVTPLIDVLLVLLIIFMVIVPVAPKGLKAMAPQSSGDGSPNPRTIVVQVLAHGTAPASYKINQEDFPKTSIQPKLAEIFAARQEKVMFVKGDADLTYNQIAEVVDMGHRVGVQEIGMLTPAMDAVR